MQLPPVSVQACTVRSDYSAVTYTKVTLHYTYGKEIGYGIRVNKDNIKQLRNLFLYCRDTAQILSGRRRITRGDTCSSSSSSFPARGTRVLTRCRPKSEMLRNAVYTQYGESKSPPRRLHKPNPSQSCRAATSPHASPVLAERQLYGPTHAVT